MHGRYRVQNFEMEGIGELILTRVHQETLDLNLAFTLTLTHRLNMELDLQKFIWAPCAQRYSLAETPHSQPPLTRPPLIYEGAIGQPK